MFGDTEAITASVLGAALRGDPLDAPSLLFLLRQYRDADRGDLGEPIGRALADALERHTVDSTAPARAAWLRLFAEAADVSDDPRVADAARALIAALGREWRSMTCVDEAAISIDACMGACRLANPAELIPAAIDELERVVGGTYRPGLGVGDAAGGAAVRGPLCDQIHASSALLTAYALSGRLPYSMLAEELMRLCSGDAAAASDFALTCDAVRVLCRLAALHDDEDYRRAAIVAADADYRRDAGLLLERLSARAARCGAGAAMYGIALGEWRACGRLGGESP